MDDKSWPAPIHWDPLSTESLAAYICWHFESQEVHRFDQNSPARFEGAGLYAIYYLGSSVDLYLPLAGTSIPLYVGSAMSHNSATGLGTRSTAPLHARIKIHHKSISSTADLPITEFGVRRLLLPDVHIRLGENALRVNYTPVWNSVLTGFGSNEQGSSTRQGQRTKWDTVHPGRSRSYGEDKRSREILAEEVRTRIKEQVSPDGI
ncbi:Eco29kI family restriction endonuclease [Frankia sp. CNm7]|uniref:Eco29kI family restriction endonuclease n=1 Tax=Frankia nepalensis TaxID=1836974 RepID=A0A937UPS9_9ACTN|nr:Eco29kI family restriction endonuclease [Frankia nepalensis]MBL7509720.1 Eco29kI family restriction endonuclease [Frankia nepalensis]MBL7516932.1 Eco29kI family restriction endonuclease [Frankia nepalensis]MBL7629447.1 Eco29kI family restriction endonuclease [Frankia nepalensis]